MGMPVSGGYEVIEDRYLVAASLAGRPNAYDELVRRYRGAATLAAYAVLGSNEAAQDVAQEAFLTGYRQLAQLKVPAHFGAWLRIIVRNLARRLAQKESRSRPVDGEQMDQLIMTHDADRVGNPATELLKKERDAAIRGLLSGLPAGMQRVLELYYYEQWDVNQIAAFLSLTRTTVKWRLFAGRKQISRQLGEMLFDEATEIVADGPTTTKRGAKDHGKEPAERDKAYPAHSGRDRVACAGR
jgi:RNA polymerase sigma factor (sigma-70 family)